MVGLPVVIEIPVCVAVPLPVRIRFSKTGEVAPTEIMGFSSSVVLEIVKPVRRELPAPVTTVAVVWRKVVTSGPPVDTMSTYASMVIASAYTPGITCINAGWVTVPVKASNAL